MASPMTVAWTRSWNAAAAEPPGSPHRRVAGVPRRAGRAHRLAQPAESAPNPAAYREMARGCWWGQTQGFLIKNLSKISMSWLQVFRSVHAAHLGHGEGQER